jgi:ribonucleoside-diphosphate reductase alpha chain
MAKASPAVGSEPPEIIEDPTEIGKVRALLEQQTSSVPPPSGPARSHESSLDAQLEEMMGDAPVCDACGHITVRNGACYKCLNCGNSMGCS